MLYDVQNRHDMNLLCIYVPYLFMAPEVCGFSPWHEPLLCLKTLEKDKGLFMEFKYPYMDTCVLLASKYAYIPN